MKLWLDETNFIEVNDRKTLSEEIAIRSRSFDWMGIFALLPDPDPVLQKTGQDITVYRQTLSDSHVWSCYESRKSGSLQCEWQIKAPKDPSGQEKKAVELVKGALAQIDIYQVITDMLEAPFFGMSPIEITWKADGSAWLPEKIEGKPPEWFAFDAENGLRFLSIDNMIEGEKIPEKKFLLPRYHASYQNPYGERILARCFWPVVFKKAGFKFWAMFTEKYGMPWVIGKVPRGTNDTERSKLLTNLGQMVQDAVAVINNDESIDIQEPGGRAASADIYERLVSAGNREISKAILGQTLSTELDKGGSLAATKEHMHVRADLIDQDKRMVCQAFSTLFSWITELNFQGARPPLFSFYEEEDIHKDLAARDKTLTDQGVRFTKKYYLSAYNLQEDDLGDIGEPAPQPGQSAGKAFSEPGGSHVYIPDVISQKARQDASMDPLIEPVKKLLAEANSLAEFRDRLYEVYGDMDESDLGDLMTKALSLAQLAGRYDAKER